MTKQEAIGEFVLECLQRGIRVRFDAVEENKYRSALLFTLLHKHDGHEIEWKTVHSLSEEEFDRQLATAAGRDELLRRAARMPGGI